MDNEMDNQELISALADGQLQGEALARGVQAATCDAHARQAWCSYHVVGEVLRTGRAAGGTAPEAFLARLRERLADEAPAAAPRPALTQLAARPQPQPAANDWIWKMAAGVASVAAVAAVGWNMAGSSMHPGAQPQLAVAAQPQLAVAPAASAPAAIEASTATMMRDPRLDQLLAAHRQFAGTPSGFLRNAAFEAPAR